MTRCSNVPPARQYWQAWHALALASAAAGWIQSTAFRGLLACSSLITASACQTAISITLAASATLCLARITHHRVNRCTTAVSQCLIATSVQMWRRGEHTVAMSTYASYMTSTSSECKLDGWTNERIWRMLYTRVLSRQTEKCRKCWVFLSFTA